MPERDDTKTPEQVSASPGYASAELARALKTATSHADRATRERAETKAQKWMEVLTGMLAGTLQVGSRKPIQDAPTWATPEVIHGGFVTGRLQAGGPLDDQETRFAAERGVAAERRSLNEYLLTEPGLTWLIDLVESRAFRLSVPEQGALLCVAWLGRSGHIEAARAILQDIEPYFDALRFSPVPHRPAVPRDGRVFVQDVGTVVRSLQAREPRPAIAAQRVAIEVWAPLYDEMIALVAETVDGTLPRLTEPRPGANGVWPVDGGWPFQRYPDGWAARALDARRRYTVALKEHPRGGRARQEGDSLPVLAEILEKAASSPKRLSAREVGRCRLILARTLTRRGAGERRTAYRVAQRREVSAPGWEVIAHALARRLANEALDEGLDRIESALAPIDVSGDAVAVPRCLSFKVERAKRDTPEGLIGAGIIPSGDVLAVVLPQLTADIAAAGIADPSLRHLYAELVRSFRKRRSLLLLNLESQVRFDELPWVAPLSPLHQVSTEQSARTACARVVQLQLSSFPHAIVPNKLLQEIDALSRQGGLDLPLVEEVAADIFMGTFTAKFLRAAQAAARMLRGGVYERYYGIDFEAVLRIDDVTTSGRRDTKTSPAFDALCKARAGSLGTGGVAANGKILEQQQILTTQNLAVLVSSLGLHESLQSRELARACLAWIFMRQQLKLNDHHAKLVMLKNTAYAWRQMVFYLALSPAPEQEAFVADAREQLAATSWEFQRRFAPAIIGLERAVRGEPPEADGGRVFLGWTTDRHWLMP